VTTSVGVTFNIFKARWKNRRGTISVAEGRNQLVDDLPILVDRPVDVPPDTIDPHARLVDEPPVARRTTRKPGRVGH
jgi:hypothetical protein